MPRIIPIKDLKNTSEISQMCHSAMEPIFVTKNGYGDMVIMSMQMYEETQLMHDVYYKMEQAEKQVQDGRTIDADTSIHRLREKYDV